jgi:hypothetical protein
MLSGAVLQLLFCMQKRKYMVMCGQRLLLQKRKSETFHGNSVEGLSEYK